MRMEEKKIDVDAIIRDIRVQILAERKSQTIGEGVELNLFGETQSPAFYKALYRAWLLQQDLSAEMHVTESTIPVIGRLIDALRGLVHRLVLFYVQRLAEQQKKINEQLIVAISELSLQQDSSDEA